jgi:hypothetical protein
MSLVERDFRLVERRRRRNGRNVIVGFDKCVFPDFVTFIKGQERENQMRF